MRGAVRQLLGAVLLALYGGQACALIPDWSQAGWVWAQEQRAELSGIHVFQRALEAPSTPVEMARVLSMRLPQLNRLQMLDGQILLSGLDDSHHWLASIEPHAAGGRAVISALALREESGSRGGFDATRYAPADARLQFSHVDFLGGQRVGQALYASSRSPSVLARLLTHTLSRAGWSLPEDPSGGTHRVWTRTGERLRVVIQQHALGSLLWLQHRDAEAP